MGGLVGEVGVLPRGVPSPPPGGEVLHQATSGSGQDNKVNPVLSADVGLPQTRKSSETIRRADVLSLLSRTSLLRKMEGSRKKEGRRRV